MNNMYPSRLMLAMNAPTWWFKGFPKTVGGMRDELIKRDIIPPERAGPLNRNTYTDDDVQRLRIVWAFDYAKAMMEMDRSL